jgi:transcription elongation GreA/GreB family factor
MSRAFVKENSGIGGDELPDRPISSHPNYVTPQGMALIDAELARLGSALLAAGDDRAAIAHVQRELRYWRARRASAEVVPRCASDQGRRSSAATARTSLAHRRRG